MKCNPNLEVLRQLARHGVGFDCASIYELDLVQSQGINPNSIIFANPCKPKNFLRYARQHNVEMMTFDNKAELRKIASEYPAAQLVLRILADDDTALCRLGLKYGACIEESKALLQLARELNLNVMGISFHVGSGAKNVKAFDQAIQDARTVWGQATSMSFNMRLLDIGGGFTQNTLAAMAPAINSSLDQHFDGIGCEIIAEPGRYFAEGAFT